MKKKLLDMLANWRLPNGPWKWGRVDGNIALDMGETQVQDPKGKWHQVRAGVLFPKDIEFLNMHPAAPDEFVTCVHELPMLREMLFEMLAKLEFSSDALAKAMALYPDLKNEVSEADVAGLVKFIEETKSEAKPRLLVTVQ